MKKLLLTTFIVFLLPFVQLNAKDFQVQSPDGKIIVTIKNTERIFYSVSFEGGEIISDSPISLTVNDGILGINAKVKRSHTEEVYREIHPVVRQKSAVITDHYNQLRLDFKRAYSLLVRVYDDGLAFRWETGFKDDITVLAEEFTVCLRADQEVFFPQENSMYTHQEREYLRLALSGITPEIFSSIPLLIDIKDGPKVAVTEAGLYDYPGMYLSGTEDDPYCLKGIFPYYPLETKQTSDRDVKIIKRTDYMAKTKGDMSFPWRVLVIAGKDGQLIESQMVFKLSGETRLHDLSWIKPGKVAWDWWNANNVYDVDFEAGINTETYKHYIDFASEYEIEYIIMDEGWYELGDLMKVNPEIDMEELTSYAKQKNVGIILWVIWKTLDDQLDEALEQFEKWEIKGIKVDFMQRDDQWMVNYYWRIAKAAADHHLLVDFHGSYKPSGLRRAYPNVLTREGVRGLEWSKWSDGASPENAVTIPFIRMLAGPLDYTPGAMINATESQFKAVYSKPMSQGTRCQQMAMYVVYESPLQMLADSPTHYMKEEECMEFLTAVPTVWDETVVLDASVGNFVLLARRSGNEWYIGAMTDWDPRDLKADLSFLHDGEYTLTSWQDGFNANRNAEDYKKSVMTVTMDNVLDIHLAPGGGWVARIVPR